MSTLIAIPAAGPGVPAGMTLANRRLAAGLLVSLLLHALLLLLQFGVPGLQPGPGGPLSIVLVPAPAPSSAPVVPVQAARSAAVPVPVQASAAPGISLAPASAATPQAPLPRRGFTLRDPAPALPAPPTPKPVPPARRVVRKRTRPRVQPPKETLHTEVIARQASEEPAFILPQPEAPAMADAPDQPVEREDSAAPAPELARQAEEGASRRAVEEEAARTRDEAERELAQQREAEEARRVAEQQRIGELARQQLAEQQRAQQLAEQGRAEELARQQLVEQQRAQQLAEQGRAEELARQQLAEQQRAQQLAEQGRAEELARQQLVEQQRAQQLAEQRRAEELARQQLAEQQRAQQLAEQRRAEELARQQLAEQQRAGELARQQAEEAARRLARQEAGPGLPAAGAGGGIERAERGAGSGLDQEAGRGAGAGGRGLPGQNFSSRARELLRGIDIAKAVPPVMRAAEQAQQAMRRALADAARRDLPLRMYIDSVRQKIERNAIVSQTQLSSQAVQTDPVVSIAIRSDGSIEDVIILRSSGRPDIDEIVRRIVRLNARYSAFPPNVAANYDVIELRRIWTFAGALRLVEEVR
jgi:hypothetical protein